MRGESTSMSDEQKEGALVFFGKARCYLCHNSPGLSSMEFHALGTNDLYEAGAYNTTADDPKNLGRGGFTNLNEDMYRFKVPQLYNVKDYSHYFHGSSKTSLQDVIDFKIKATTENALVSQERLSTKFQPLDLTDDEVDALTSFLETGLYDSNFQRYVPEVLPSGNCFPNNDPVSQKQLRCN